MIVRRINKQTDSNATISVRCTWAIADVAKLMKRIGDDLRATGLPVIAECELREIVGGVLFAGFKDYQAAPLIDWAISVARRAVLIKDSKQAGKVTIEV